MISFLRRLFNLDGWKIIKLEQSYEARINCNIICPQNNQKIHLEEQNNSLFSLYSNAIRDFVADFNDKMRENNFGNIKVAESAVNTTDVKRSYVASLKQANNAYSFCEIFVSTTQANPYFIFIFSDNNFKILLEKKLEQITLQLQTRAQLLEKLRKQLAKTTNEEFRNQLENMLKDMSIQEVKLTTLLNEINAKKAKLCKQADEISDQNKVLLKQKMEIRRQIDDLSLVREKIIDRLISLHSREEIVSKQEEVLRNQFNNANAQRNYLHEKMEILSQWEADLNKREEGLTDREIQLNMQKAELHEREERLSDLEKEVNQQIRSQLTLKISGGEQKPPNPRRLTQIPSEMSSSGESLYNRGSASNSTYASGFNSRNLSDADQHPFEPSTLSSAGASRKLVRDSSKTSLAIVSRSESFIDGAAKNVMSSSCVESVASSIPVLLNVPTNTGGDPEVTGEKSKKASSTSIYPFLKGLFCYQPPKQKTVTKNLSMNSKSETEKKVRPGYWGCGFLFSTRNTFIKQQPTPETLISSSLSKNLHA